VDVIEHREGGENTRVRKIPGMTKYSNIVLKWGLADDRQLYDWHREVIDGTVNRKGGSIVLLDRAGQEVARWVFERAWPTVYNGPDLNAESSDVAIETLELAHEGLKRQ
jgi:phage tail-like protein